MKEPDYIFLISSFSSALLLGYFIYSGASLLFAFMAEPLSSSSSSPCSSQHPCGGGRIIKLLLNASTSRNNSLWTNKHSNLNENGRPGGRRGP